MTWTVCEPQGERESGKSSDEELQVTSMPTARQESGGDILTSAAEDGVGWRPMCWLQPATFT